LKSPRALNIAMCFVVALLPLIGACTSGGTASPDVSIVVGGAAIPGGGVDFGTCVYLTSNDKTITVTNLGNSDLQMSGTVSITSGHSESGDFAIVGSLPSSITIPAGDKYDFTLRYHPDYSATYPDGVQRRETVTVTSDDPDEGSYSFDVYGTASC
jgi:hypothetical protein